MSVILIIDDEPDIVEILEATLGTRGHRIITANSGDEGLSRASREKPDLILLDVMLPGIDGFNVCKRIKESAETKNIPILMLTALNQLEERVRGLDAGADDFIGKPFNDSELKARVNAFLRTKNLRDRLEESYIRLKELEQMRDSLTHMLVHDLKVPLTAVKGSTDALLETYRKGKTLDESDARLLEMNSANTRRILDLIQDILDVSRLEEKRIPANKAPTPLLDLFSSCVEIVDPVRQQYNHVLTLDLPRDPVTFTLDADLIRRVLVNLISNSFKFSSEGGRVSLRGRLVEDGGLELTVEDNGIGIAAEHLGKIFDKFYQVGSVSTGRKGQGLGLAFCRLAVEAHGGTIRAESETGKGTRFIMRLPA